MQPPTKIIVVEGGGEGAQRLNNGQAYIPQSSVSTMFDDVQKTVDKLARGALDFNYFCKEILGLTMEPYHDEWCDMLTKNRKICVVAARGHGKTTYFGVAYFLWQANYCAKRKFLLISHSMKESQRVLQEIKDTIDSKLPWLVPRHAEKSWNRQEITTTTDCRIFCRPYSHTARGLHCHGILCDEASEYADKSVFYTVISPIAEALDGQLIVTGTPKSQIDLLAELAKNKGYAHKKFPAIVGSKPLSPARFPIDKLERIKRDMGSIHFTREYLCEPLSVTDSLFPPDILAPCITEDSFELFGNMANRYVMGCDFALSKGKAADSSAFVILKELPPSEKDLKEYEAFKRNSKGDYISPPKARWAIVHIAWHSGLAFEAQLELIDRLRDEFKPDKIVIDANAMGLPFLQKLQHKYGEQYVEAGGFGNKTKRHALISLRQGFADRRVLLPGAKDEFTMKAVDALIGELNSIGAKETPGGQEKFEATAGHDDLVMGLLHAWKAASGFETMECFTDIAIVPQPLDISRSTISASSDLIERNLAAQDRMKGRDLVAEGGDWIWVS
jgi:hypothetical protein